MSQRRYAIRKFPRRWREILLLLVKEGSVNKHEAMGLMTPEPPYSTVHKAFKRLAEDGLISATKEGVSRAGLTVESYSLTVPGLAITIAAWKESIDWEGMARTQKRLLPRVFGKWERFVREGAEALARKSLLGSVNIFLREYDWDVNYTAREAADKISKYFIMTPKDALEGTEVDQWYRILAKDRELRSWAVGYVKGIIASQLREAEYWNRVLKLLEANGQSLT